MYGIIGIRKLIEREEERCQDHCASEGTAGRLVVTPAGGEKNIADLRGHVIVIEALEDKVEERVIHGNSA